MKACCVGLPRFDVPWEEGVWEVVAPVVVSARGAGCEVLYPLRGGGGRGLCAGGRRA